MKVMQSVRGTYENGQVILDGEFLPEKSMLVIVTFLEEIEERKNNSEPHTPSAENAEDSLEAQIAEENKLLDEEFERVLQTEGGPVRLEDLHRLEVLKNTFQGIAPERNTEL